MDKKTYVALKGSIEKWRKIRDEELSDFGTKNCPLCQLFYANDCAGCPISEKVNDIYCRKTPYAAYSLLDMNLQSTHDELREAAQDEMDFLISLLPSEE